MDAFDADVLIYAATAGHPLGQRVRALFPVDAVPDTAEPVGCGSVLLVTELLAKPLREEAGDEVAELAGLLGRLELRPVDLAVAELAAVLGARRIGFEPSTPSIWRPPSPSGPTAS